MEINSALATNSIVVDRAVEYISSRQAAVTTESAVVEKRNVDTLSLVDEITTSDRDLTAEFLQKTIDRVNKHLRGANCELNYSFHEKTGQYMVKVIDRDTGDIIREIPPEKTLDAVAKMWEMMGIFLDKRT